VGDVVYRTTQPAEELLILLTGHLVQYVDRGAGPRRFMEWRAGDVTGLLPYSRMITPPGDIVIEAPSDVLAIHRRHFSALISECPDVASRLVHVMLDRARHFTSNHYQDEKMMSLGRLAAGLAHELNNPASAAARSAALFAGVLAEATQASHAVGAARLSPAQRDLLDALRRQCLVLPRDTALSAIERADLEDEIAASLDARGADTTPAAALAESGVTVETLDRLALGLSPDELSAALRWIAAELTARSLASDVQRAATRIYDLVSAVKRFTYMDRATVAEPANIAQGLADTVSVLAAKARARSVDIHLDVAADLPFVRAHPAELTQVWSNLLENALDAVAESGHVTVSASREENDVVVRVVDDGPGIPTELHGRIFDPFFTTKPVGQGTGLGLDITRRIVRLHNGQIDVDSQPGRTEFRVALPIAEPPP
jgi:signal transduction histidine kinase